LKGVKNTNFIYTYSPNKEREFIFSRIIMLAIRFNRVGKRNRAHFRIVVQEHTIAPGGTHVEVLGSYDPHLKKSVLKADRIKYWIEKGAQTSESAHNLFLKEGIIEGKKKPIYMKQPKKAEVVEEKGIVPEVAVETPEATKEAPVAAVAEETPVVEAVAEAPKETPAEAPKEEVAEKTEEVKA